MDTNTHPQRWSGLYLRQVSFALLVVALATGVASLIAYQHQKMELERQIRAEALGIVSAAAASIDGTRLLGLQAAGSSVEQERATGFMELRDHLQRVQKATTPSNDLESTFWILRPSSVPGDAATLAAVVTTDRTTETPLPTEVAQEALNGNPASGRIRRQASGADVSAAAPIRDRRGVVVGVLLMERSAAQVQAGTSAVVKSLLLGTIISSVLAGFLAVAFAGRLTSPLSTLLGAFVDFGEGRFHRRIRATRSDEIGDLQNGFNRMADQLLACRDSVERQKQELIDLYQKAQAGNRAKGEFLATMSHEIRTPMNGILGFAELLLESELTPEQRAHVELVQQSARGLLTILNDILDLSRIEAGGMPLESTPFDVRTVVHGVVDFLAVTARRKGIRMNVSLDEHLPPFLSGDPTRLRQILLNLASNAVKFTESGEVNLRVKTAEILPDSALLIRFEVQDSGIGISPEARARLFQPFSQADADTARKYGGTGLGLVISQRLVERMQGQMDFESKPGRGSTFWFTVRLQPARPAEISNPPATFPQSVACRDKDGETGPATSAQPFGPNETDRAPVESPTTPPTRTSDVSTLRVLIAEDNDINRVLAIRFLARLGYRADVVSSGTEVLEALNTHSYEIVLMDCLMPGLDGCETTRRIRFLESQRGGHVHVIAMTANAMREDRERCLAAGMDDYLTKPLRREDLAAAMERAAMRLLPRS